MAADSLKRIGDKICQDYLGFNPTSNSTKPPHIANGLFRACIGETCDTRDVHEWVISDGRKDALPSEKIVADYACILEKGEQEKPSNIKQFRYFLGEIFNQDNTLYPQYDFSVMDISSHWMVKGRLNSEAHIGDFIFEILAKQLDGKRSPVISLLQEALSNDSDDLTKLIKPILTAPQIKKNAASMESNILRIVKYVGITARKGSGTALIGLLITSLRQERIETAFWLCEGSLILPCSQPSFI